MTAGRHTPEAPGQDAGRLLALRRAELDALFARAEAGPLPDGECRGTLILPLDAGNCSTHPGLGGTLR